MSFFYQDQRLRVGTASASLDIPRLAAKYGSPLYIYDLDDVRKRFAAYMKALSGLEHTLHYAMKANSHPALLGLLASVGAGVDTVSAGEIRLALAAGFTPDKIIFSGVGKTVSEIEYALRAGIKQINVESPAELERIAAIAGRLKTEAQVAFRLNPDVNPRTHPYITTGFRENKFGMDESFMPELIAILQRARSSLKLVGLTMHIGSQLFDINCFREAIEKMLALKDGLEAHGHRLPRLDLGGGLGIRYETGDDSFELDLLDQYGRMARTALAGRKVEVLTEPGRFLVARAGILVGEVQYIKRTPAKTFAILNTGMHHLLRPALYGAQHRVLPVNQTDRTMVTYDIVGPICESSDFLAKDRELPELKTDDLVAVADSGAYGYTMSSRYNAHEPPREIAVCEGREVETRLET